MGGQWHFALRMDWVEGRGTSLNMMHRSHRTSLCRAREGTRRAYLQARRRREIIYVAQKIDLILSPLVRAPLPPFPPAAIVS